MANGTQPQVDPLAFLNELLTQQAQPGPIESLGLPQSAAPVTTTPPPAAAQQQLAPPEFPQLSTIQADAPQKSQRVLSLIADLFKAGAGGRGRVRPSPSSLGRLQRRRDEDSQLMRNEALGKYRTDLEEFRNRRTRGETVSDDELARERQLEDVESARTFELGTLQDARDFQEMRDFNKAQTDLRVAGMRNSRAGLEDLKERRGIMSAGKRGIIATKGAVAGFLQSGMTPDQIRENFSDELDVIDIDEDGRLELMLFWEKKVEPLLLAHEAAQANQPTGVASRVGEEFAGAVTGTQRPDVAAITAFPGLFNTGMDLFRGIYGKDARTSGNVGDEARERRQLEEATRQLQQQDR